MESGSRHLLEMLLPKLYGAYPTIRIDVITCYGGAPPSFRPEQGRLWRTGDHSGTSGRAELVKTLGKERYSVVGIICSDEPIMMKWKWMLAARLRAKLLIINENTDYFWFDRGNWNTIFHFVLIRSDLNGVSAVVTLARCLLFPVTLLYLLAYASMIHLRRKVCE